MKKTNPRRSFAAWIFLLFTPFLFSCEKELDILGLEITPPQDQLYVTMEDTFSVLAYSERIDSIITNKTSLNLAGALFDPVFGRMTSGFASQFVLSSVSPNFGNNPVLDSLVLVMAYNGSYGDTSVRLTLHVYELDEQLYYDSTYYSNHRVRNTGVDYGYHSFFPHPTDSVGVDTLKLAPQLRIRLDKTWKTLGNKILYAPADYLTTSAKFTEYMKGLQVTIDPVSYKGSMLYFNMLSTNTRLRMYYHNDSVDSLRYDMLVNETCQRFNQFDHFNYDFASQPFRKQVLGGDTLLGNDVLYVQSMGGVRVKLRFPTLKQWAAGKKIAINEARLVLPAYASNAEYEVNSKLLLVKINEDGSFSDIPDAALGSDYFGGTYYSGNNAYQFRITQYIQDVMKPFYDDRGLYLMVSGAAIRANRVVLAGPKHTPASLRLKLTYSYIQ